MAYRDILAPVISIEADEAALVAAGEIAEKFDARAIALIVAVHLDSAYTDEARPLSQVLSDIASGSRSHAARARKALMGWIERSRRRYEVRDVTIEHAVQQDQVVAHARMADLIVMARSAEHDRAGRALIEDILFKSGRPVLLMPDRPLNGRRWESIVIGWNAKAEAVRAVTASLPLLQAARQVVVATVDAVPSAAGHAEAPGRELAAHLARHGVRVEVRNLDGLGRSHAKALVDEAVDVSADALVMGAYGHSRAQEYLFGGVTRELLAASPIPLLLAH
jgi:nucleotide-binding universal stress UspA family protein